MPSIGPVERTLIAGSLVNGSLGTAIGALMAGMQGAKMGLILGLLLAALPLAAREFWSWLGRPNGLPRFLIAQIGAAAITVAQAIASISGSIIGPVVARTRAPVLIISIIVDVLCKALAGLLRGFWRIVATPLGMANTAAVAVIIANLAGFSFASPIAFLGLGMLLLVLLVSESERRDEEAAEERRRKQ